MGASFSGFSSDSDCSDGGAALAKPRLGDIPESCVASVLMHLDPPEICGLARLNRAFRGASSADFIWESKLPENYGAIVEKVLEEPKVLNLGKKEIYARLCRPSALDGGTKVRNFSFSFFRFFSATTGSRDVRSPSLLKKMLAALFYVFFWSELGAISIVGS